MRKIVIAIDGFSSCGKSTMAKDLAREVGYIYVDTGAMYRSVTLYALRNNLFDEEGKVKEEELISKLDDINICFKLNEQTGRPDTYLNGERVEDLIRSLEVSQKVSPIAACRKREARQGATEDGRRQRHRHGRPRHRYRGVP